MDRTDAGVILHYGVQLVRRQEMRWPLIGYFTFAFGAAGIAGVFGAFITKAAPVF